MLVLYIKLIDPFIPAGGLPYSFTSGGHGRNQKQFIKI